MQGGVIAHKRGEDTQLQETLEQVFRGVAAETAQVTAAVQETAEVQVRQHLQGELYMAPPGEIVPLPHAAVTVCADEGTAREEQHPLVRREAAEGFRGRPGHAGTVEVVDSVVADGFSVRPVVKAPVVFRIVGDSGEGPHQATGGFIIHAARPDPVRQRKGIRDPFIRIEQSRFVHIVPEAFDPGFQQRRIETAEPAADILPQEIRETAAPGPDGGNEVGAVLFFAEGVPGFAGVIRGVAFFDLDARVDDRDQAEVLLLHSRLETLQVWH